MRYLADEGLATADLPRHPARQAAAARRRAGRRQDGSRQGDRRAHSARELVRLQCYEGIDAAHALYEWNYQRQLLAIRQAGEREVDIYDDRFLIARPLLQVLQAARASECCWSTRSTASDHEFEALLLEFLSDFQITIPERGTIVAAKRSRSSS